MKRFLITIIGVFATYIVGAQVTATQASPSNLNAPATAQPVPNSIKIEKSATGVTPLVPLPSTATPPIYPGAEVQAVETQRNLIHPAAPPAPTQPVQTQSLRPVESTNNLHPTHPQREQASRENPVTELPAN